MASITSWMRLEPNNRQDKMNTGLQAMIYDPLWLLARQWQLGEFQGEDNGSPVIARWQGESAPLTRFHSGAILPNVDPKTKAQDYDNQRIPLEALVERETIRTPPEDITKPEKLKLAVESGQQFLRMLEQQPLSRSYRDAFIKHYPLPQLTQEQEGAFDRESISFVNLMAKRVPDGRLLYAAFNSKKITFPATLTITDADFAEVEKAGKLWLQWLESLFSEPNSNNSSWLPERMEYAFSVGGRFSDGECVLTSKEYFEGHLDWHAFDVDSGVTLGATTGNAITDISHTVIPAPVSYRGMPAARFWEFEDAQVDFGAVEAGPNDLIRMLLVEFALVYGNDWFVIPIELEIGTLNKTRSLVVTDTFGVRTLIKPASELPPPHSSWKMYQLSNLRASSTNPSPSGVFYLPPALLKSLESRPIEEVLFLRDEMANMAWGVERLIESPIEKPLNRFEDYQSKKRLLSQETNTKMASNTDTLHYQLTTEVPDYWIPLLPVSTDQGLRLKRGAVLKTDGTRETIHAKGHILNPGDSKALELFEEEVPREGIRVTRSYQFTRWIDGSSHIWMGRRKSVGRGEGSSGLSFDTLTLTDKR
jgi:hypothetical protein